MNKKELTPEEEYAKGIRDDNLILYAYLSVCVGSIGTYIVFLILEIWKGGLCF
jgi:hypothetical protein